MSKNTKKRKSTESLKKIKRNLSKKSEEGQSKDSIEKIQNLFM